jgi:hypothetical protein
MLRVQKPKIYKYPSIGRNKFESTLRNTPFLDTREVALYSYPGRKPINVSFGRNEDKVSLDHKKIEIEYKTNSRNLSKNKSRLRTSKGLILHTHILVRGDRHIALPSIEDILTAITKYNRTRHGYEIIGVIDENKNVLGYTTLKIDISKIKKLKEDLYINEFNDLIYGVKKNKPTLLDKISILVSGHPIKTKVDLYKLLPELGFEIYFTPMPGYKLDNNFNYIKKK